MYTNK